LWYECERARVGNLLVCYVFAPVALGLGLVVICECGYRQGGSALCASM